MSDLLISDRDQGIGNQSQHFQVDYLEDKMVRGCVNIANFTYVASAGSSHTLIRGKAGALRQTDKLVTGCLQFLNCIWKNLMDGGV